MKPIEFSAAFWREVLRRWFAVLVFGVFYTGGGRAALAQTNPTIPPPPAEISAAELEKNWGVGPWIWDAKTFDKQNCRFWRAFEIPPGVKVTAAYLRISVDNGYRLRLDGRELGVGSDWRSVTEYDVSMLLKSGRHVVAVEAFNDNREAGMQFGLKIFLSVGRPITILSDTTWYSVPEAEHAWQTRVEPASYWKRAVMVSSVLPREKGVWAMRAPTMIVKVPLLRPEELKFWQRAWFQVALLVIAIGAVLMCVRLATQVTMQARAQALLNRERARIARDIHDELGARLTELALESDVAQTEFPPHSAAGPRFADLSDKARALSSALDEIVWMVNSRRDTLRDFVTFACQYAQRFLAPTRIRCRLDVGVEVPELLLELPVRRNLLLAVKEALNNAVKYSAATELCLHIHYVNQSVLVIVEDNGKGFDLARSDASRNGLTNLTERMHEVKGQCRMTTRPGEGCRVELQVPLSHSARLTEPNHPTPTSAAKPNGKKPASTSATPQR